MLGWWDIVTFIRCISRQDLDPAAKDYVLNFVEKDVPWENIAALAAMEGVAGFVYYHLRERDLLDRVPKTALKHLENDYTRTKKHFIVIMEQAEDIAARLKQAQIPVLALQGLSLFRLYNDAGLRPIGDMDLMVKPGYKKRLKELLKQAGYHVPYPVYPDIFCKGNVFVDIHTHILNLDRIHSRRHIFPADLTFMWNRAIPFSDQKDGLLCLDPFDNFVALAAHALKHSYSRLIWLVDLHECLLELAQKPGGWEKIVERARLWHQESFILYALILVEKTFGLQVPAWGKQELGIDRVSILEKHLLRLRLKGFSSMILCNALWIINIEKLGDKLEFIKENFFPKDEVAAQLFYQSPPTAKKSAFAKRIVEIAIILGQDLYQALALSGRIGGYG